MIELSFCGVRALCVGQPLRRLRRSLPALLAATLTATLASTLAMSAGAAGLPAPAAALPVAVSPAASSAPAAPPRPRIGLALSGGGARGFSHVGILRALERLRVPIDCIAGTSAGSAVAAAYAVGLTPDEIEARLRRVDWSDIFADGVDRTDQSYRRKNDDRPFQLGMTFGLGDDLALRAPEGLVAGHKIELFLHDLLGVSTVLPSFDRLAMPFRAIATDLASGEMVAQREGSLVRAVRASMSVPSAFAPVREAGRLLVDGGLTRNLPVDVVRNLCADVVIAVNIGSPLLREDEMQSLLGVAAQMVNILIEENVRRSLAEIRPRDVLILPELGKLGSSDFASGVAAIPAGEQAAMASAPALAALALAPADYQRWDAARRQWSQGQERVDAVRIAPTRFVNPTVIEAQITGQKEGQSLNREALRGDLSRLMASGDFSQIDYRLINDQGASVLWLRPQEKSLGPNYLRFGFGAAADSNANSLFNLAFGYNRTWVNSLGAEWNSIAQIGHASRLGTQFFQPLSPDGSVYLAARLMADSRPLSLFIDRLRISDYSVKTTRIELMLGAQGKLLDLRAGVVRGQRTNELRIGLPLLDSETERFAGFTGGLSVDRLDAIDFPRAGWALDVSGFAAREAMGGSAHYNRAELVAQQVGSRGSHTLSALLKLGYSPNSRLPPTDSFSLGGFLNLSGLQINQLLGSQVQYGRLMYYNQVMSLPKPFGSGLYAGMSLEVGRVSQPVVPQADASWVTGASVFVGANTGIGPVYLGVGHARHGGSAVYLFLGRP
jgi:NTE family protein